MFVVIPIPIYSRRCNQKHKIGALGIGGRVWQKVSAFGVWGGRVSVALFCAWGVLRGKWVPPRALARGGTLSHRSTPQAQNRATETRPLQAPDAPTFCQTRPPIPRRAGGRAGNDTNAKINSNTHTTDRCETRSRFSTRPSLTLHRTCCRS